MRNITEVVREGYKSANLGSSDGIVQIYNHLITLKGIKKITM